MEVRQSGSRECVGIAMTNLVNLFPNKPIARSNP
jgi:hypothetical protein